MRHMDLNNNRNYGPFGSGPVLPDCDFVSDDLVELTLGTSSKGNQQKWVTNDHMYYIKSRFEYSGCIWNDNMVEVVASRYAALCTLPLGVRVVKQGICTIDGSPGSYSEAFDIDDSYFCSFVRLCEPKLNERFLPGMNVSKKDKLHGIIDIFNATLGYDATPNMVTMFLLDLVVANEDRHLNNFGFLITGDGNIGPAPLFDFGLGLFEHDAKYDGIPWPYCLKYVKIKPTETKPELLLDILLGAYGDIVNEILPKRVEVGEFKFPSGRARDYFVWINERLGVKVV